MRTIDRASSFKRGVAPIVPPAADGRAFGFAHPTGLDFSLGCADDRATLARLRIGRRKTKRLQAGVLREVLAKPRFFVIGTERDLGKLVGISQVAAPSSS